MPIDIDTSLLRNFIASVRLGSLSRAAEGLGRTQPSVSQQLRRLEDLYGAALLERTATGVTLTDEGQNFLPYAERILALAEEALTLSAPKITGRCCVGVLEDFTGTILPAVFAEFARIHPDITLELISLEDEDIQQELDQARVQLALCGMDASTRHQIKWSTHMPLLWVSNGMVDQTMDPLPLVVFSEPCQWRNLVQAALGAAGRESRVVFQSNSLSSIQASIRAGLGVGVLLPTSLAPGIVKLSGANVLPRLPDVEVCLLRRHDSEGDKLVDLVEDMLKQLVLPCG